MPENRQALERKRAVASTVKSSASLAWFDPDTCSLRTSQQSLLTDSEPSSLTLPRSGMTRNGYVYELPIVGRITCEIVGGYWPTPRASMGKHGIAWSRAENGEHRSQLEDYLAHLYLRAGGKRISGLLVHPSFCETMMGWPTGFTVCTQSVTGKMRSKRLRLGDCSEANE